MFTESFNSLFLPGTGETHLAPLPSYHLVAGWTCSLDSVSYHPSCKEGMKVETDKLIPLRLSPKLRCVTVTMKFDWLLPDPLSDGWAVWVESMWVWSERWWLLSVKKRGDCQVMKII